MKLRTRKDPRRSTDQTPSSKGSRIERLRPPVTRLTKHNLRRLTKELDMPRRKSTLASSSTTRTTTTDRHFPEKLQENGIHFRRPTFAPDDFEEIKARLEKDRESASPSMEDYVRYGKGVDWAENEATLQDVAWHLLSKPAESSGVEGYHKALDFEFSEVDNRFTDGGLSSPEPDITESLRLDSYPLAARECLGASLRPTQYGHAMPNFAVEYKGPNGAMTQATYQSAYNGATMTEACGRIHEHMSKPLGQFYGKTQALTVASDGRSLEVYANHARADASGVTYHQHQVVEAGSGSFDRYKLSRKYVRNAQDWARERAVDLRSQLTEYHQDARTKVQWTWSGEHGRYYRTVDGKVEWYQAGFTPPPSSEWPASRSGTGKGRR